MVVKDDYHFYKILEESTNLKVIDNPEGDYLSFLRKPETPPKNYTLERIITSPMRENSDIIYVYKYSEVEKKGE